MDRPGLTLLYVSLGYTTHDRRFLQLFRDAGLRACHLRLLGGHLDSRTVPEGIECAFPAGDRHLKTCADFVVRWRELRQFMARVKPDVVLAGPVPTATFLAALTGFAPLIAMSWGSDLLVDVRRSRLTRFAARYALRRSRAVFGDCRAVLEAARSLARFGDDQLLAFPWGIDLENFSPAPSALDLREKLGWVDNPVIIATRSWEPVYAVDILVKGFALIRARRPSARLLLLGDGSLTPEINALIDQLGVREIVHAPGRIGYDLLPQYFRLADCYASSALSDGTSVSLLEAMACGLPAIVTNGYGNVEWVAPGRNGWLVEAGNPRALAAAMLEALDCDPGRWAAMKRANVEEVRARADWGKNGPRLIQLIGDVAQVHS